MSSFNDTVSAFNSLLAPSHYQLRPTSTRVVFKSVLFGTPIFALPDVHLCDGNAGDIFRHNSDDKPRKLQAVLQAFFDYMTTHPMSARAVQLGDWFDIWRVVGSNPQHMTYGAIQNAAMYQGILDLDARLGLAHLIGNHDAAFLNVLPDRRAAQPQLFRSGFWLGSSVYAMHGHQTDIVPPISSSFDEAAVALATTIAGFIPGVSTFEAYVDRLGFGTGIARWLLDSLGKGREDPGPQARPEDLSPPPANVRSGQFVVRENIDQLATIAHKIGALSASGGRSADVVIVGHSHTPSASWTDVTGRPIVVVDAGAWVYDQANLLIAAEDTIAVFDVTRT
jgi:UDP-2,3-diacylglucosamine pyrophosphatase LpxH